MRNKKHAVIVALAALIATVIISASTAFFFLAAGAPDFVVTLISFLISVAGAWQVWRFLSREFDL